MSAGREVDVLVAGAGPAGMTAALVAHLEGLNVLLCEKSNQVGGTGATSAGTIWIPGNSPSREAGFQDSVEDAEAYLDALIPSRTSRHLRSIYLQTGKLAIDYLRKNTDVQFLACGRHPDYRGHLEGAAVSGRAIIPQPFDGRLLGTKFERVRPPIKDFMILGGMMIGKGDLDPLIGRFKSVDNFIYALRLLKRYLFDRVRYSRGTRLLLGNALIARLFYSIEKERIPVWFNAPLSDLVVEDGRVVGAKIRTKKEAVVVSVKRGVILATGGCGHNQNFRNQFMPKPAPRHSLSSEHNEGDGISIAQNAGALIRPEQHGNGGLWSPVSVLQGSDRSVSVYPHLILDRAKPGIIAVNSNGKRFVNEADSYHDFVEAMFRSDATGASSTPCYLVCDSQFIKAYGLGLAFPGTDRISRLVRSGYLFSAQTLTELGRKISVNIENLIETVDRHNSFAETGIDLDFHKGESELNRFNGDERNLPNACLRPIATAPFFAIEIWPADIAVSTGLVTGENGEVFNESDMAIEGLYACGNDMASPFCGQYPGPGTTLGPGIVFGYRAAMKLAGKDPLHPAVTGEAHVR